MFRYIAHIRHIIAALSLALFSVSVIQGADQDLFDVFNLEIEGDIYGYITADIDGDRLQDIAVIYSPYSDLASRYIGLFLQKPTGFNRRADYLASLPKSAVQINAYDINQDEKAEIVIIDSEGVGVVTFNKNTGFSAANRIIRQKSIFAFPIAYGILTELFMFEINDRPGPEIIIPTAKGYVIYEKDETRDYKILNQLSVPISCRNTDKGLQEFSGRKNHDLQISLAGIHVLDGNLDGLNDLYFLWDKKLCVFFQDSTGNFAQTPDNEVDFYAANTRGYFQSQLIDYNGDRRPDLAVSYTSGGITNTETKIRLHPADTKGHINPNFTKEISLSDSHCNLILNDYDGDNRLEMVIPAIEIGSLAATKMLLMKKADLHLLIYPFENGLPSDEPSERLKYEFRFNFDDPLPTGEIIMDWSSDYNGDSQFDMIFSDGNGKIKFYWGKSKGYLSEKPDLEVSLEHALGIRPIRLSDASLSDVIIEHCMTGRIDRLTVLKNKNN